MEYSYNINGVVRKFRYHNIPHLDGVEGTMEELFYDCRANNKCKAEYINCYRDENNDLFFVTHDGFKVLCKDAITLTPEEFLREAYENHSNVRIMDEMLRTMQKYGIGCIRFRMNNNPMDYISSSKDEHGRIVQTFRTSTRESKYEPEWVEYEAHAEYNRMPADNYKLCLYAARNPEEYLTHEFYTMDLNHMWISRPDYMQLTIGKPGTPTGIYSKQSDKAYLRNLNKYK